MRGDWGEGLSLAGRDELTTRKELCRARVRPHDLQLLCVVCGQWTHMGCFAVHAIRALYRLHPARMRPLPCRTVFDKVRAAVRQVPVCPTDACDPGGQAAVLLRGQSVRKQG
jgi:hypothetical protein